MLYIVGLGLNEKSISADGLEAVKKCEKVYLEDYTIEFPYKVDKLEKVINKKVVKLGREGVEGGNRMLIKEARKKDVCLLVYGSPLFATTHISLIQDCKKAKVKFKIIYNASVFDAAAETGLQLYKFGKISSMPKWIAGFKPTSFLEIVKENNKINAHSLILIDIGLSFKDALNQLVEAGESKDFKLDKILVCSQLGTSKSKIYYGNINKLQKVINDVKNPFCFIILSKMHFLEKEVINSFETLFRNLHYKKKA